jgi:DnaK suppressor protein
VTKKEKDLIAEQAKSEIKLLEKSVRTLTELLDSEVQSDANDWFTTKESNPSKEINEMALEKARKKIIILKEVLGRIDNPEFGICTVCGGQITVSRLKAVPAATRCINCS